MSIIQMADATEYLQYHKGPGRHCPAWLLQRLDTFEMIPLFRLSSPFLGNGNGRRRSILILQREGPFINPLREQRQISNLQSFAAAKAWVPNLFSSNQY